MEKDRDGLTAMQEKFVEAYCSGKYKTTTDIAIAAGYSEKSACSQASQLLKNPKIVKKIDERRAELRDYIQKRFSFVAKMAIDVLVQAMLNPETSTKDRTIIARDLLDRAGYKPVEKAELSGALGVGLVVDDDI